MTERDPNQRTGTQRPRLTAARWRGILIAAVVAAIGIAAIIGLSGPASDSSRYAIVEGNAGPIETTVDPLRAELMRCRTLPPNADDARCRDAWEVNRRRFLGESRSLVLPPRSSGEPGPDTHSGQEER